MEHVGCTKALVYPKFSHLSTLTMETKVIIFICFVLLLIVGAWYCLKWLREDLDKRLYIYPKTEHTYLPIYRCKLKCPSTGEWFDVIIYIDDAALGTPLKYDEDGALSRPYVDWNRMMALLKIKGVL